MPINLWTGEITSEPLIKKTPVTEAEYAKGEKVRITPEDIKELYEKAVSVSAAVQDLISRIRAKRVLEEAGIEVIRPKEIKAKPPTETEKILKEAGIEMMK